MTKPIDQRDSDRLGELACRFRTWAFGIKWIAVGMIVLLLGLVSCKKAGGVFRPWAEAGRDHGPYLILGWACLGSGAFLALRGLLVSGQVFEVYRKGVRYRSWFGRREMLWRDIAEICVLKVIKIFGPRGGRMRATLWTIRIIASDGRKIVLRPKFLEGASALQVIQMLKLHRGRAMSGDHEEVQVPRYMAEKFGRQADDEIAINRKRKKKPRPSVDSGTDTDADLYRETCRQLDRSTPLSQVEAWLQSQGVTAEAAMEMVDRAMAKRIELQANPTADAENDLVGQARKKLADGMNPERVERWLRQQGVGDMMVTVIMENLRQERL